MIILSIMFKILAFLGLVAAMLAAAIIIFLLVWAIMTIIDIIRR